MKYLATIYQAESGMADMTEDDVAESMSAYEAFGRDAAQAGVLLGGEGLTPSATATTIRVRDGERLLTDGPFAETKELIGGIFVIDCPNLDVAIELAAKIPTAEHGSIEVRPLVER